MLEDLHGCLYGSESCPLNHRFRLKNSIHTPGPVNGPGVSMLLVGDEGQQRNLTGAFDGLGQLALMHGAGAGGTAG